MKNPLENLISLKRWEEDEAKNLFVLAKRELEEEEARLDSLEDNFKGMREAIKGSDNKTATIDEIRQRQQHIEHLVCLLQLQKDAVAIAGKRLEEATRIMAEASMERKVFEKVDERHKEAEKYELHKKEERDIDEHAVMRYKKNGRQ
jgi:flagellar export protein FliJ